MNSHKLHTTKLFFSSSYYKYIWFMTPSKYTYTLHTLSHTYMTIYHPLLTPYNITIFLYNIHIFTTSYIYFISLIHYNRPFILSLQIYTLIIKALQRYSKTYYNILPLGTLVIVYIDNIISSQSILIICQKNANVKNWKEKSICISIT